jgi:anti-sigma factor RsiW
VSGDCAALEPLQSAWVDGRLDAVERARMARHLGACARCRAAIDELDRLRKLLRSLPVRSMPAGLVAGTDRGQVARRVAAIVLVLAGLAGAFGGGDQPSRPVQTVRLPSDVYSIDHLVRAAALP